MKKSISNLKNYICNMNITSKIIICYILVVFIPIIILSCVFITNFYEDHLKELEQEKLDILNQRLSNLHINMVSISNTHDILHTNKYLLQYLDNYYTSTAEEVYVYLNDIVPLFQYAIHSNPYINDIKIYRLENGSITSQQYVLDFDAQNQQLAYAHKYLETARDLWNIESSDNGNIFINYYTKIYNNNYSKVIGLLEINVNKNIFFDNFSTVSEKNDVYFMYNDNYFRIKNDNILPIDKKEIEFLSETHSSSFLKKFIISGLNADFYLVSQYTEFWLKDITTFMFFIIILLLCLSAIYYFTVIIIITRINRIIKHIQNMDYNNLTRLDIDITNDEIGLLTNSFNTLIDKINLLIVTAYHAEIDKKEADYYALQAQIKPHFIYNTLENIRMMAEINGDDLVSDMIHQLGSFIRYNISYKKQLTYISDEIENVKNYLRIYKIRLGDTLNYKINIKTDIDNYMCPKFILQPIVENCIHHGFMDSKEQDIINLSIYLEDSYLIVLIEDNGIGIEHEKLIILQQKLNDCTKETFGYKKESIGLLNVNRRLKHFFDLSCGIELMNGESGCCCKIRMKKKLRQLSKFKKHLT